MGDRAHGGLRSRLAILAGLSPLLCALPAQAEPFETAGGGVFLGYAFGKRGGFEWGIEGFATRYLEHHDTCESSSIERRGFGPLLRLSVVKLSRLEFTLAGHIAADLPDLRSVMVVGGELGASIFFEKGHEPLVGAHSGATVESVIFNLYARQGWLFERESVTPALSFGGGARSFPTLGTPGFCVEGRPYRGERGEQQVARVQRGATFEHKNPRARLWARRSAEECASVPAFLQLASELLELGAPLDLVARAVQAADEELRHTHAATQLAELFGGAPLTLMPPPQQLRRRLPPARALERLVRESWLDGCLNEGLAATLAEAEAGETRVTEEARISKHIARDEAGHAALAFDVLRWAVPRAPATARALRLPRAAACPTSTWLGQAASRDLHQHSIDTAARRLGELRG